LIRCGLSTLETEFVSKCPQHRRVARVIYHRLQLWPKLHELCYWLYRWNLWGIL